MKKTVELARDPDQLMISNVTAGRASGVTMGRGRPSRKKIDQLIAASKSSGPTAPAPNSRKENESAQQVETLLGVASLLNPEIEVQFVSELPPVTGGDLAGFPLRFLESVRSQSSPGDSYFGLVSSEGLNALGVTPKGLRSFIKKRHGFDVYFGNFEIDAECIHINQWQHRASSKPGFAEFAREFLRACGLGEAVYYKVMPSRAIISLSLVVGNSNFWNQYTLFLVSCFRKAALDPRSQIFETGLAEFGYDTAQCLLAEFVRSTKDLKPFKFKSAAQEKKMDPYKLEMRTMKDLACKSRNLWMIRCWMNYRYLYLHCSADLNEIGAVRSGELSAIGFY